MDVTDVWLDALRVGPRHRAVDESRVAALADSMKAIGLQQPISVWFDDSGGMHLVAGLHRVWAAESLGWEKVAASVLKMDATERELWEISENLHRVGLTKEERDEHIRRYAELLEKRREVQSRQTGAVESKREDGRGHRPAGVAKQIAEETGISQRTVQRVLSPTLPRAPAKQTVDDHGDPNMSDVAERLARKYTVGQLQEVIDHLTDVIVRRMAP